MKLAPLVEHLASLPVFAGRVVAAATLDAAIATVKPLAAPSCVLFGVRETAAPNEIAGQGGPRHRVTLALSLLSVVRHVGDMRGAAAFEALDAVRADALRALLGWQPTGQDFAAWEPLEYAGGQFAYAEAGTVLWQDNFTTRYTLSKP